MPKQPGRVIPHGEAGARVVVYPQQQSTKENHMLYTLAVVLILLWLLGLVTSYTMGGFIHILLVVALIMVLVNFLSGRRAA